MINIPTESIPQSRSAKELTQLLYQAEDANERFRICREIAASFLSRYMGILANISVSVDITPAEQELIGTMKFVFKGESLRLSEDESKYIVDEIKKILSNNPDFLGSRAAQDRVRLIISWIF